MGTLGDLEVLFHADIEIACRRTSPTSYSRKAPSGNSLSADSTDKLSPHSGQPRFPPGHGHTPALARPAGGLGDLGLGVVARVSTYLGEQAGVGAHWSISSRAASGHAGR